MNERSQIWYKSHNHTKKLIKMYRYIKKLKIKKIKNSRKPSLYKQRKNRHINKKFKNLIKNINLSILKLDK